MMKIAHQTEDELIVKEGGEVIGIVVGVIFLAIGGYVLAMRGVPAGDFLKNILFPGVLLLVGIALILFSPSTVVAFQKAQGEILFSKKRLIGTKTSIYNIADVLRVELRKEWQTQQTQNTQGGPASTRQVLVSQTVIMFKDGRELMLGRPNAPQDTISTISLFVGGRGKELALAQTIATFINVPFQEVSPPGARMGFDIGTIGKILN